MVAIYLQPPNVADPLVGSALGATFTSGCTNQDRALGISSFNTYGASQVLYLAYFRTPIAFTAANVAHYSVTAAGATPTLVKYALFSVAANGDLTRIAITASDTTVFSANNTRYPLALTASVGLVPGQTYASGVLLVSGASMPALLAPPVLNSAGQPAAAQAPRMNARVLAQADIAASYASASAVDSTIRFFAEITT